MQPEKVKDKMEKLFKEKLLTEIQPEAVASLRALELRQKLAKEIEGYQQRLETAILSVHELQALLDKQVLENLDTKRTLRELEVRSAEQRTFERQLESLAVQDQEAEAAQKAADQALRAALHKGLSGMRKDVEARVGDLLSEALATLIYFEEIGLSTCRDHGMELPLQVAASFPRFLSLDETLDKLSAYLSPVGERESQIFRKKIRQEFAA